MEIKIDQKIIKIEKSIWNSIETEHRIGLLDGMSGIALFYSYLIKVYKTEEYENKLISIIEKIDVLLQTNAFLSHHGGLAGYGLMLLKIKNENLEVHTGYFKSLDTILIKELKSLMKINKYDFLHGAIGISLYFIERYKNNPKNIKVKNVLLHFTKEFIFKIENDFADILVEESAERGFFYSFGLAHGVAGYINHLIYLKQNFEAIEIDTNLLINICREFLLRYKKYDFETKLFYPNIYNINESQNIGSRLSWCQSDLGIANALLNAGTFLKETSFTKESQELLANLLNIEYKNSQINDFGICHGSCGLILQYYLFKSKNINLNFDIQINNWLDIVKKQTNDYEIFLSYNSIENKFITENNFLNGTVGLGLTLLTIHNKINSKWTELLHLY